jgi:hypothetical protein
LTEIVMNSIHRRGLDSRHTDQRSASGPGLYLAVERSPLEEVIQIGRVVSVRSDFETEFTALELRGSGGILLWRAKGESGPSPLPALVIADATSTEYVTAPAWLEGVDWARRGGSAFAPRLPAGMAQIELVFPGIGRAAVTVARQPDGSS